MMNVMMMLTEEGSFEMLTYDGLQVGLGEGIRLGTHVGRYPHKNLGWVPGYQGTGHSRCIHPCKAYMHSTDTNYFHYFHHPLPRSFAFN